MDNKFSTEGLRNFFNAYAEKTYYVRTPVSEDIRGADWEYSKIYTKSLVAGITTSAEMTDILTRRGIVGPEFEQRSNELSLELGMKINALENSVSSEEKATLAYEVAKARDVLFQWTQRLNQPLSNTCEQISDDARLEYLTSRLIVDDTGTCIWADYDKYLHEKNQSLAQQSKFEVMLYLQGLDSDFLDKTPEAIAMHELEAEATLNVEKELVELSKVILEEAPAEVTALEEPAVKKSKK
ncbi:hypothetical protein JZU46_00100 [bacterium]|nr:hypothetical protein [bacterium]